MEKKSKNSKRNNIVASIGVISTIILGVATLIFGDRSYKLQKELNASSVTIQKQSNELAEGNLLVGLLPSLLSEKIKERDIALEILKNKCDTRIAQTIYQVLQEKSPGIQVPKIVADRSVNSKAIVLIQQAILLAEMERYDHASSKWKDAVQYIESNRIDYNELKSAKILLEMGRFAEASGHFSKAFAAYIKEEKI